MNLQQIAGAVLVIVLVGIIAVVGMQINTSMAEGELVSTTNNETVTLGNSTTTALSYPHATSLTSVGNATGTIGSGNFTIAGDKRGSTITTTGYPEFATGSYWVVYTYGRTNDAYYAAENSTAGMENITGQLSLIGLIIIMAAVIALLWGSFSGMLSGNQGGL